MRYQLSQQHGRELLSPLQVRLWLPLSLLLCQVVLRMQALKVLQLMGRERGLQLVRSPSTGEHFGPRSPMPLRTHPPVTRWGAGQEVAVRRPLEREAAVT